jgi:hypothetical protein
VTFKVSGTARTEIKILVPTRLLMLMNTVVINDALHLPNTRCLFTCSVQPRQTSSWRIPSRTTRSFGQYIEERGDGKGYIVY